MPKSCRLVCEIGWRLGKDKNDFIGKKQMTTEEEQMREQVGDYEEDEEESDE